MILAMELYLVKDQQENLKGIFLSKNKAEIRKNEVDGGAISTTVLPLGTTEKEILNNLLANKGK